MGYNTPFHLLSEVVLPQAVHLCMLVEAECGLHQDENTSACCRPKFHVCSPHGEAIHAEMNRLCYNETLRNKI